MRQIDGGGRRRRLRLLPWVFLGLMGLVVLELAVIILVGRQIGVLWTLLMLLVVSVVGMWLLRREGARTYRALRTAVRSGEMPSRQLADGILVLIGGILLVLPGFVTDVVGLVLVLPFTRPLARPMLEAAIGRRIFRDLGVVRVNTRGARGRRGSGGSGGDEVIEGEIIE